MERAPGRIQWASLTPQAQAPQYAVGLTIRGIRDQLVTSLKLPLGRRIMQRPSSSSR